VLRAELVQGGLSIYRSLKRIIDDVDPSGYSSGDVAQLLGDATGIASLFSALAPGVGLISLTTGGAAATADTKTARQVLAQLKRNFGRLAYLQGAVDARICEIDKRLGDLDPAGMTATEPAPRSLGRTGDLSDAALKASRAAWAAQVDETFEALRRIQEELGDLDDRRRNLGHQIDAVGDLLIQIEHPHSVSLEPHLVDAISYGRGWFFEGDSAKMAVALSESVASAAKSPRVQRATVRPAQGPQSAQAAIPGRSISLAQWVVSHDQRNPRLAVRQALAGLERWRGFYDTVARSLEKQVLLLRVQADAAVAMRRDYSAEAQRRALEGRGR
jgi:hypothetical protein